MPSKLIILTGAYGIVNNYFMAESAGHVKPHYFTSLLEELKRNDTSDHWVTCSFLGDLLMLREINRDMTIRSLLENQKQVALVEEWHIGNVAWLQALESPVSAKYRNELHTLLQMPRDFYLEIWHVSIDPDKLMISAYHTLYQKYLRHLSDLRKQSQITLETLDGDAASNLIDERIKYLLSRKAE